MPLHLNGGLIIFSRARAFSVNNDPNQEINVGAILLSKSTDLTTVYQLFQKHLFWQLISVVQDCV